VTIGAMLESAGTGPFHRRMLVILGLVWAADAMQVLSIGFTAPSIARTFQVSVPVALQTGTAFFLGMMVGAASLGKLADRVGRRKVLIATVALDGVFGLLSAVAPSFEALLALRLCTGVVVGGTLAIDYALFSEFLPPSVRGRWLVLLEGFWAIGTIALALLAWLASQSSAHPEWRVIFGAMAIPALVGLWMRRELPESPMFLVRKGSEDEAYAIIARIHRENNRPMLEAFMPNKETKLDSETGIFSVPLRSTTLNILTIWLMVSAAYYGIFVWLPARLAAEGIGYVRGYGFLVLLAVAQLPGYALAAYGVERWGRRVTLVVFLLLSAIGSTLFVIEQDDNVQVAALVFMSFALLGTWGALYAMTPETFPTSSRAAGMGAAGSAARLGGLGSPSAAAAMMVYGHQYAIGLFATMLGIAAFLALLIPNETKGRELG
jgi:MFS transporter, putative metabolite:H+ symporter